MLYNCARNIKNQINSIYQNAYSIIYEPKDAILPNLANSQNPFYVFWAPEGGIPFHHITHSILAKSLLNSNKQVILINCSGSLPWCNVKDSLGLMANNSKNTLKKTCTQCKFYANKHIHTYNLPTLNINRLLDQNILNKLYFDLNNLSFDEIKNYTINNINFGQIAIGEVMRNFKVCSEKHIESHYNKDVINQIISSYANYIAFKNLAKLIKIKTVLYFGDYGSVLGLTKFANDNNINLINISHGLIQNVRRDKLVFMKGLSTKDQFDLLKLWPKWQNINLPNKQIMEIGLDVLYRFNAKGFTIYSPNKTNDIENIFSTLNLKKHKKTIVAYTSSLDETMAAQLQYAAIQANPLPSKSCFNSQIEWLQDLIEFAQNNNDYQLIIRIHPREATNGYNNLDSENLIKFKNLFDNLDEPNIKIIWPLDKISSYDLGELADLVLVAWTSMSMEMARLAVPTIAAFEHYPIPKDDFVHFLDDKSSYFQKIKSILDNSNQVYNKINLQSLKKAFNWFYLQRISRTIDISDIAPDSNFEKLPKYKDPKNQAVIADIIDAKATPQEYNYQQFTNNTELTSLLSIQKFIRNACFYLLFNKLPPCDYEFLLFKNYSEYNSYAGHSIKIYLDKNHIFFAGKLANNNYNIKKYSPLLSRIIPLANIKLSLNKDAVCSIAQSA